MWAFGLLLLKLLGGDWPQAHHAAVKQGFQATLAYSNFMCHQYPNAYLHQVRHDSAAAAAAAAEALVCSLVPLDSYLLRWLRPAAVSLHNKAALTANS